MHHRIILSAAVYKWWCESSVSEQHAARSMSCKEVRNCHPKPEPAVLSSVFLCTSSVNPFKHIQTFLPAIVYFARFVTPKIGAAHGNRISQRCSHSLVLDRTSNQQKITDIDRVRGG
jgi:hypothetical protein